MEVLAISGVTSRLWETVAFGTSAPGRDYWMFCPTSRQTCSTGNTCLLRDSSQNAKGGRNWSVTTVKPALRTVTATDHKKKRLDILSAEAFRKWIRNSGPRL